MQLGGLRLRDVCQNIGAERINTEKPPYPLSLERKNLLLRETWPCSLFPLGERSAGRGKRSLPQIGIRLSNTMPIQSTSRAGRVVPFSNDDRCSSEAGRAMSHVHPVTLFAPCILQAPRPAATFGSFWSLQKEHAVGREFGEKGILPFVFVFCWQLLAAFSERSTHTCVCRN